MQHNWVLSKQAKKPKSVMPDASWPDKAYVPESPEVIAAHQTRERRRKDTITFKAPAVPGDYPFFCTFPGHSSTMREFLG